MDPGERPIRFLIAAQLALGAALAVAPLAQAGERGTLSALTWTDPAAARAVLLRQPAACEAPDRDAGQIEAGQIDTGRALFNTPQLLGGQAARAAISCASCHANGRRSAHFQLDGISAGPGTADVSAGFFSVARDDGRFDPKPIPDLAVPGKIARSEPGVLEAFLRTLIVGEFAGHEPPPAAISALAAYVRAIRPCPNDADQPQTMARQIELVRAAVRAAAGMAARGEPETAALLISGARHQLGLIDERLPGADLAAERAALLAASRALQPVAGAESPSPQQLRGWLAGFDRKLAPRLKAREARSLYRAEVLERWLARR